MSYSILFSNIGYARGIDGSLRHHLGLFARHLYCPVPVQEQVLAQLKALIAAEEPDLCCFVEIDSGSAHSGGLNQLAALLDAHYAFHDISNKYGQGSLMNRLPFHAGKSNALLARHELHFERLYFRHGTKRLIYSVTLPATLPGAIHVFCAHFSLNRETRRRQFAEVRQIILDTPGETILLADFNIFSGFAELEPLLQTEGLGLLSNESDPTFAFAGRRMALDLCLASPGIMPRLRLRIVPQPFSDHAALLVTID